MITVKIVGPNRTDFVSQSNKILSDQYRETHQIYPQNETNLKKSYPNRNPSKIAKNSSNKTRFYFSIF